jgi:hypothetical protein
MSTRAGSTKDSLNSPSSTRTTPHTPGLVRCSRRKAAGKVSSLNTGVERYGAGVGGWITSRRQPDFAGVGWIGSRVGKIG